MENKFKRKLEGILFYLFCKSVQLARNTFHMHATDCTSVCLTITINVIKCRGVKVIWLWVCGGLCGGFVGDLSSRI